MKMHTKFSFAARSSLALALVLGFFVGSTAIAAGRKRANGAIDAEAIAAEFKVNPKAAEAAWRNKPVVITGTILRLVAADLSSKAGSVVFKTGEGMPAVKVDFADISDPSSNYEFRVTDAKTLEVRIKQKNLYSNNYSMFSGFAPKQPPAPWNVLLSVGETVTFSGQCLGRQMYITIGNGNLLKEGWQVGGGGALARNGGNGSTNYDPAAEHRRFETHQQVQMQNQQINMQQNQQSSMQQVQQMLMNQRR